MVMVTQAVSLHRGPGVNPLPTYILSYAEELLWAGVPGTTENREIKLGVQFPELSIQSSPFPLGFYQETRM